MEASPPAPEGVAKLYDNERRRRGLFTHKALWAVAPDAPAVTVRARSYYDDTPIDFLDGDRVLHRLLLPASTDDWTYAPTAALIPGPGCYAFDLRGPGVRQTIVFKAVRA